jgi:hypothetical protein
MKNPSIDIACSNSPVAGIDTPARGTRAFAQANTPPLAERPTP